MDKQNIWRAETKKEVSKNAKVVTFACKCKKSKI